MKKSLIIAGALVFASSVLAHSGVENAAVKARMDLMQDIRKGVGALGGMAKGEVDFDAEAAEAARAAIATSAAGIPAAFEAQETDPESTSKDNIWTDWEKFTAISSELETAAGAMDASSLDGVRAGIGAIGATCSGCHKEFRIKK